MQIVTSLVISFALLLAQLIAFIHTDWVNRIIGGHDAIPQSAPWLVSINVNDSGIQFLGGGVIINKDWILTVGHNFGDLDADDLNNVVIGYGSSDISKQSLIKPKQIVSHFFDPITRLNDIAFVNVPNIGQNLTVKLMIGNLLSAKSNLTLIGWGAKDNADGDIARSLQETTMTQCSIDECRSKLLPQLASHYPKVQLSEGFNFCVLNLQSTACYGDSGSPVFSVQSKQILLYGLVSWGNSSCSLSYPNVATKLYKFKTLIQNLTNFDNWL